MVNNLSDDEVQFLIRGRIETNTLKILNELSGMIESSREMKPVEKAHILDSASVTLERVINTVY